MLSGQVSSTTAIQPPNLAWIYVLVFFFWQKGDNFSHYLSAECHFVKCCCNPRVLPVLSNGREVASAFTVSLPGSIVLPPSFCWTTETHWALVNRGVSVCGNATSVYLRRKCSSRVSVNADLFRHCLLSAVKPTMQQWQCGRVKS